jgi:hypothetical protein
MIIKKTYGSISFNKENNSWIIEKMEPHVSIRFKQMFPKVYTSSVPPYSLVNSPEVSSDLKWFFSRYPVDISEKDQRILHKNNKQFFDKQAEVESIMMPNWVPSVTYGIQSGQRLRGHQKTAIAMHQLVDRLLLVDAIGTGKSYTAIGAALQEGSLPAAFVVQAHLPSQFKEKIEEFSHLKAHIIKTGKPYSLPKADIYIFKYSILSGWVDIFAQGFFKFAMFDEVQELRHGTSTNKGFAANILSSNVEKVLATTATPIYGYGIEMFNVLDMIKKGSLGSRYEFIREWCGGNEKSVVDPNALGSFLRESQLMLRRTKKDIYGDTMEPNIIIEKVDYDEKVVKSSEELAKQLAITALTGSFTEQGSAARELDLRLREATGIAKAKNVAMFVRMLVQSGEKVLLSGWHRDVYEIWNKELSDLGVVMYTGSENAKQKDETKREFVEGNAQVLIISHKSGAGLDGLQHVCSTVVLGELAWSKEIHGQIFGRVDRDGQKSKDPVSVFVMISDYGSDPVMMDLLGIKHNQQRGILDPNDKIKKISSDRSRLKDLARNYLLSHNVKVEE